MKTPGFCSTENSAPKTVHSGFMSNIKLLDTFDSFPTSQRSLKSELCTGRYEFLKFETENLLLFIIPDEIGKPVADFYCSQPELKSATRLLTSHQACTTFKAKSTNGSPTSPQASMNLKAKSTTHLSTSFHFLTTVHARFLKQSRHSQCRL